MQRVFRSLVLFATIAAAACSDDSTDTPESDATADGALDAFDADSGAPPDLLGDATVDAPDTADADPDVDRPVDCFAPTDPARWTVCEGQLHDPQGRRVRLRGVNVSQPRKLAPYEGGTSADDIAAMRVLGFNHVRLLWSWAAAMPTEGELDEAYLDRLAGEATRLSEAGIIVVLDSHQDLYGEAIRTDTRVVGNGAPAWACPAEIADQFETPAEPWFANYAHPAVTGCFDHLLADTELQDEFAAAWAALASRVATVENVVGYDLWNEPFWGTHNINTWERELLEPLYQRLAESILGADPDAVLFVEPGAQKNVLGTTNLPPLGLEHIVYSPHLYDPGMESGETWSGSTDSLERRLATDRGEAASFGAALYIGEWGTPGRHENDVAFAASVVELLDDRQISWAVWQWGPGGPGSYALIDGEAAFAPHAESLSRPAVTRLAGADLTETYEPASDADPPTFVATFRAERSDLDTIVVLPTQSFGANPSIAVDGGTYAALGGGWYGVRADAAGAAVTVTVN